MKVGIEAYFVEMQAELRQIENIYNPQGRNLHFESFQSVDSELFEKLLYLSNRAILIVKDDEHRYAKDNCYSGAMFNFWYDYFLIMNAISKHVIESGGKENYPYKTIKSLIDNLIIISEFSIIVLGDIFKRNYEALGNTLLAFYDSNLISFVEIQKASFTSERVKSFVDGAIKNVRKIVSNRK